MKTLTEILVDVLSETKIFEMANDRAKYMDLVHSLTDQIVQNWCLIKYCNMYDEENYNRLHWSKELIAHLGTLQRQKIKGGLDKERATREVLIEREEIDDVETVNLIIINKFEDEHIDINLTEISTEFVKQLDRIIYIITKSNPTDLRNYVYNEI